MSSIGGDLGSQSLAKVLHSMTPIIPLSVQLSSQSIKGWCRFGLIAATTFTSIYFSAKVLAYFLEMERMRIRQMSQANGRGPVPGSVVVAGSTDAVDYFMNNLGHQNGVVSVGRELHLDEQLMGRSPKQLILYGLKSLKTAVTFWEKSKFQIAKEFGTTPDEFADPELEEVIEQAKQLITEVQQEVSKKKGTRDQYTLLGSPSSRASQASIASMSSPELRLTPEEMDFIDRRDETSSLLSSSTIFFDAEGSLEFFKLYNEALEIVADIEPPRVMRTIVMRCSSDDEFKAKVHCLRQAFDSIFAVDGNRQLFQKIGRDIVQYLSITDDFPVEGSLPAYDEMIRFVNNSANLDNIRQEINARGIVYLSFYDVVLDYMILESFDDIDNPPSSVSLAIGSTIFPESIKKIALRKVIHTFLGAKRKSLIAQDGFFSHFYDILEFILPVLAWGFFGTDEVLRTKCKLVREVLLETIRDFFNFDCVRFTNVRDLSYDIVKTTWKKYDDLRMKLNINE